MVGNVAADDAHGDRVGGAKPPGWIRRYFETYTRGVDDPAERRRVDLLVAISLLAVVNLVSFAVLAFLQHNRALAGVDLGLAALLAVNLGDARRNRRFHRNIAFGVMATGVLYVYLLVTGGVGNSAILWYYTFPLISAFLLGSRRGIAASLALAIPALGFFLVNPAGDVWASYSRDFEIRFIPSYLLVCALSFLFEFSRERAQEELHLAKETAEQASLTKSRFLASMSHELRTPLNAVIGFSEVLAAEYFGTLNDKQKEYVADIHTGGNHLLSLINDVLDLAKVEAGKMEIELSEVDMAALLTESLMMVRDRASRRQIELDVRLPEPPIGPALGEALRLRQVVYNLLSNAVKFTPAGGLVGVELKERDGYVVVSVSDTGVGVAPEEREQLFREFYQARGDARDKTPGTGLGLALARHLVELHGGRIWVESEGRGRGSRFSFSVPRA